MKSISSLAVCFVLFFAMFAGVCLSVFTAGQLYFVTDNIPLSVCTGLWVFVISDYVRRKVSDEVMNYFSKEI